MQARISDALVSVGIPSVKPLLDTVAEGDGAFAYHALQKINRIYGEKIGRMVIEDYIEKEQDPTRKGNLRNAFGIGEEAKQIDPQLPQKPKAPVVEQPATAEKSEAPVEQSAAMPWYFAGLIGLVAGIALTALMSATVFGKSKK